MFEVILFFILQLINVVLSTIRSIFTIKGSKHTSAIMNAVSYTFYSAVVKLVTSQDMFVVVSVTFITNIIGVYLANFILEKFKKDKLWRITCTVGEINATNILSRLSEKNIQKTYYQCDNKVIIDIYSYSQGESVLIKEILKDYKVKYCIMEIDKKL